MVIRMADGERTALDYREKAPAAATHDMYLLDAINAPRFHHQWLPDHIKVEPGAIAPEIRAELEAMGHQFEEVKSMARVKAIHVLPNGDLQGVGDARNPDDDAEGY